MDQKQIGAIIGIIGILLAVTVFMFKIKEDRQIQAYIDDKGTCYLDDGTCLHDDRDMTTYTIGWILSAMLILVSLYMVFVDKTQEKLMAHQKEVSSALNESKKKDEFSAFLSAFDDDNKKILKTIKENEGITQATLRFKTGLSKAHLSNLINSLEGKDIISRKAKGKTYEIYLKER